MNKFNFQFDFNQMKPLLQSYDEQMNEKDEKIKLMKVN